MTSIDTLRELMARFEELDGANWSDAPLSVDDAFAVASDALHHLRDELEKVLDERATVPVAKFSDWYPDFRSA